MPLNANRRLNRIQEPCSLGRRLQGSQRVIVIKIKITSRVSGSIIHLTVCRDYQKGAKELYYCQNAVTVDLVGFMSRIKYLSGVITI